MSAFGAIGLMARGASGFCPINAAVGRERRRDDTRRALGGSHGIGVQEQVVIARPPREVFDFWNNTRNLPLFLHNVEAVERLENGRSHWIVRGPAGVPLEWDAEIINEIDGELIAWRSLGGADVASAGSVHFEPRGKRRTEVTVTLQYDPPGGKAGAMLAWLVGKSPAADLRADLTQLKRLLESGQMRATDDEALTLGHPVSQSL